MAELDVMEVSNIFIFYLSLFCCVLILCVRDCCSIAAKFHLMNLSTGKTKLVPVL